MNHLAGPLVTGIGSLPERDAPDAVAKVARHCREIPFWPQLPARSARELMINQALAGLDDVYTLDAPVITARTNDTARLAAALRSTVVDLAPVAAGWVSFLDACAGGVFDSARAIKGQLCGPVTLALTLRHDGVSAISDDLLRRAILDRVKNLAQHQLGMLRQHHEHVIIQLDEPLLGLWGGEGPGMVDEVLGLIRSGGGIPMLHCCGRVDDGALFSSAADIVSFDVYANAPREPAILGLQRHLDAGRMVAWGAVPTQRKSSLHECHVRARRWWDALGGARALAAQSIVTATCGLASGEGHTPDRSFRLCHELAAMMKEG